MAQGTRDVERQLGIAQQRGISPGDMTELVMKYCKLVVQKFETVCCPLDPEFSLMATDHHSQESNKEMLRQMSVSEKPHILKLLLQSLHSVSAALNRDEATNLHADTVEAIERAVYVITCLSIMAKYPANVAVLSADETVNSVTSVGNNAVRLLCENCDQQLKLLDQLGTLVCSCCSFLDYVFDPGRRWRHCIINDTVLAPLVTLSLARFNSSVLEIVIDGLQGHDNVSHVLIKIKLALLHLFGSLLCGLQGNAANAVTPESSNAVIELLVPRPRLHSEGLKTKGDTLASLFVPIQIFIKCVHLMHCCSPDVRQVDVSVLLTGFLEKLNLRGAVLDIANKFDFWITMLSSVRSLMTCHDVAALQAIFVSVHCFRKMIDVLTIARDDGPSELHLAIKLCVSVVRAVAAVMGGSLSAKATFVETVGYTSLKDHILKVSSPSREILEAILDMAVEGAYQEGANSVCNTDVLLLLIEWLPSLPSDLQRFLGGRLSGTCIYGSHNHMLCCQAGMITAVLEALGTGQTIDDQAAEYLITLLETLASHSVTSFDLKKLISLFRPSKSGYLLIYHPKLLEMMERLAVSDRHHGPKEYFDLHHPSAGIVVRRIAKWPGSGRGFAFHTWLCLDAPMPYRGAAKDQQYRRQLYSFLSPSGVGFEAFFTSTTGVLVVAVSLKKEYLTVAVPDRPLLDMQWHHVGIVHFGQRRPWGMREVAVFVDGQLCRKTTMKLPDFSEGFGSCHIGSAGHRTAQEFQPHSGSNWPDSAGLHVDSLAVGAGSQHPSSIPAGSQDSEWGAPCSLLGQLGPVCVFFEAITESQMKSLYQRGPDDVTLFQPGDGDPQLYNLSSHLLLFYHAKACKDHLCVDVTVRPPGKCGQHGRLTGHKAVTQNVKDALGTLGGVQVLFPLLETVDMPIEPCQEPGITASNEQGRAAENMHKIENTAKVLEDSVGVKNARDFSTSDSYCSDVPSSPVTEEQTNQIDGSLNEAVSDSNENTKVIKQLHWKPPSIQPMTSLNHSERSGVASFLLLLRSFLLRSMSNQSVLQEMNGIAIIGALLHKVDVKHINVEMLSAVQLLVETVTSTSGDLLGQVYEHLIFDFGIWTRAKFHTQIGHIQYVMTIMKDNIEMCRVRYGVRFVLNVLEKFHSSMATTPSTPKIFGEISDEEKAIRRALFSSIKFFVQQGIKSEELEAILNFVASSVEACHLIEALSMISSLITKAPAHVQIIEMLSSAGRGELLWALTQFGDDRVRVLSLKILLAMVMSNHVSVNSKRRLLLHDWSTGALCQCMSPFDLTRAEAELLMDIASVKPGGSYTAGCLQNFDLINSLIEIAVNADFLVRMEICQKISSCLWTQSNAPKLYAENSAWFKGLVALMTPPRKAVRLAATPHLTRQESLDMTVVTVVSAKETQTETENGDVLSQTVQTLSDEVCDLVLEIIFLIMWNGVTGGDSWKERGQIMACIDSTAAQYKLLRPTVAIKRDLFERCLQAAANDLAHSGSTDTVLVNSTIHLLQAVESFIFQSSLGCGDVSEGLGTVWSGKLIKGVCQVLDQLHVWNGGDQTKQDLARLGLRVLFGAVNQPVEELLAVATSRLQPLLQKRDIDDKSMASYMLGSVCDSLAVAIEKGETDNTDNYNHMILLPIVHLLLLLCKDALAVDHHLPNLPSQDGGVFTRHLLKYMKSDEWKTFLGEQIFPTMEKLAQNLHRPAAARTVRVQEECQMALIESAKSRKLRMDESKLKLQEMVMDPFMSRRDTERDHCTAELAEDRKRHIVNLNHWKEQKRFLTSERGAWSDRKVQGCYWMVDHRENFSRMRLKLARLRNWNYDRHAEASVKRDKGGKPDLEQDREDQLTGSIDMTLAKEARVRNEADDRLEDDEWLALRDAETFLQEGAPGQTVISEQCQLVVHTENVPGTFKVTQTHVYFFDTRPPSEREVDVGGDFQWELSQLREVHLRRYNLRRSALEFFLLNQTNYFINFTKQKRNKIYSRLLSLRPPNLINATSRSRAEVLASSGITQKWVRRQISNFDYLMELNTIAGRTYNDLSQYPVFPWILKDYDSSELDLSNPDVFRDLSKPMGVQNPAHIAEVEEKYQVFEDPAGIIDKFHYGTHYSNAASVMHYLIRLEPFTSLHVQLQSDQFDLADRQFYSIPAAWETSLKNPNVVKELIPEFFYLPEFLVNLNRLDLGQLQTGMRIADVILPAWAASPEDFIRQHRQALESEYVSAHIHEWIDLIFGYKQRGPAAVEAHNVFFYCTYEGAVDLDAITNPHEQQALEGMIKNFGQTPTQLLKEPHPKRMSAEEASRYNKKLAENAFTSPDVFENLKKLKAYFVEVYKDGEPLVFIGVAEAKSRSFLHSGLPSDLVTVNDCGFKHNHGWLPYSSGKKRPFTFNIDPSLATSRHMPSLGAPFSPDLDVKPQLFMLTHDAKLIVVVGHWDNSFRVFSSAKGRMTQCIRKHTDVVTCVSVDIAGQHIITGSRDTTCKVWLIVHQHGFATSVNETPVQTLFGHDSEVTAVALNVELNIAVSGSWNGTCIIHTIQTGQFVCTLCPHPDETYMHSIPLLGIGELGTVIVYSVASTKAGVQDDKKCMLHKYSVNGKLLASVPVEQLSDFTISGQWLAGAHCNKLIIRSLDKLLSVHEVSLLAPIRTVTVTSKNTHILLGLNDGKLIILAVRPKS